MTPVFRRYLLFLLMLLSGGAVQAQTSASHQVFVGIEPITVMALSGDPMPLRVVLDPGATVASTSDATTYYHLTTNVDRVYIEARVEEPLPDGVQLRLRADSSIGRSLGEVSLAGNARPRRLINNLRRGLENGQRLEYTLEVDPAVGPIPPQSLRVTLSLVNPETGYRQDIQQVVQFSIEAPDSGSLSTN